MILTKKEAAVIEMIRNCLSRKNIARKLCIRMCEVDDIVSELEKRSAIQRSEFGKNKYRVLLETYDVDDNSEQAFKSKRIMKVSIPKEYEDYIRRQYGVIPRREIARQLKLSKVTLNLMIMNLGLDEKEKLQLNKQHFME